MFRHQNQMNTEVRQQMKGGSGTVTLQHILEESERIGPCRLFSRVILAAGSSIGVHSHSDDSEIFYILRGRGAAKHNGEDIVLKEGDVMMIGDGMSHGIRNDGLEDLEFLAVIIAG